MAYKLRGHGKQRKMDEERKKADSQMVASLKLAELGLIAARSQD